VTAEADSLTRTRWPMNRAGTEYWQHRTVICEYRSTRGVSVSVVSNGSAGSGRSSARSNAQSVPTLLARLAIAPSGDHWGMTLPDAPEQAPWKSNLGCQSPCQQSQDSGHVQRHQAILVASRRHVRPYPAPSGGGSDCLLSSRPQVRVLLGAPYQHVETFFAVPFSAM
jgi:hypothetical protein